MLLAWIVGPLVLALLTIGCGLLIEQLAGVRVSGALVPPLGFAFLIVVTGLATANDRTASLGVPAVVACAVAGVGLSVPWRGRGLDWIAPTVAVAVFAVYAAPIVLSGEPTWAGYITLDDTSTWLAMTDHVIDHGRNLAGLAPSSYEATLDSHLRDIGYPVGAFLPLGVAGELVGTDIAWLFQPAVAFAAAMLALGLYALAGQLVRSRRLCAAVAFVAAQPALLFAYAMWSGIKEVTAAALVALAAALLPAAARAASPRQLVPLAIAVAAVLVTLSVGGIAWLAAGLLLAAVAAARTDARALVRNAAWMTLLAVALSIPALLIARNFIRFESRTSALTSGNELANLIQPLSLLQVVGIWPNTDFRTSPDDLVLTYVLVALTVACAVAGVALAWRRRAWGLLLYLATVGIGAAGLIAMGSPWIDGKAMATASAASLLAALAACAYAFEHGRRVVATAAALAISAGVLWSNVLTYRGVWLAPQPAMAELASIGSRFAGEGPTLMTEYQPYGVRHFLRRIDPESASELRRRVIPLLTGQGLEKGAYSDLDQFQTGGILVYRTLVLRRSPAESRPPSPYRLVSRGRYYDVWQRPDGYAPIVRHLALGDAVRPGAAAPCADVLQLAAEAGPSGRLAAAQRTEPVVATFSGVTPPSGWQTNAGGYLFPTNGSGTVTLTVEAPGPGRYTAWLGGSFRGRLRLSIDGRQIADERNHLTQSGGYTPLGEARLRAGTHRVTLEYGGPDLHPGSGGVQFGLGPLVLTRDADDVPVEYVPAGMATALCGRTLDWIEAIGS